MDAPFCMGILHGAVQARMARVWGAFCRRGSLVSAGKTFFLMVLARVLALFFTPSTGKTILRWRHSLRRYRFTVDI